jgi:hypothetical protein
MICSLLILLFALVFIAGFDVVLVFDLVLLDGGLIIAVANLA